MTGSDPGSPSAAEFRPRAGDSGGADDEPRRSGRVRRERSASESLLSIALGLEAALMFFVALTAFGLRVLPAPVALGGGLAAILALAVTAASVRFPAGVWAGWVLQVALIATGILLPVMYGVGALFAGIWIYCFVTGRRLDRAKASAAPTPEGTP